jgi:TetR/AcrR family transcriptional regulator, cholesterol catabolism regulator
MNDASEDGLATKTRIIQAATRLFAEKGYSGTGVRDIEEAVGVLRGTLYYHIGNKENLLYEITHDLIVEMNRRVSIIAQSDASPEQKLRQTGHLLLDAIVNNQMATTVFFRDWTCLQGRRRNEILAIRDTFEHHVGSIIAEGLKDGVWMDRGPLVVKGLLGMFNHAHVWFRPNQRVTADELADTFVDILLYGLGSGPQTTKTKKSRK